MKKRAGYKLIALLLCFVLAVCGGADCRRDKIRLSHEV